MKDRWGLDVTAANDAAVDHLGDAVLSYLGARVDTGDLLKAAQEADPEMVMGHVLRGYFLHLFAHRGLMARSRESLAAAEEAARRTGATPRERAHMAALGAWCDGRTDETLQILADILLDHPRDLVALKLSEYWNFYSGDSGGMRDSIGRVLHAWDDGVPGHGFVRGMYAFALEESGDYDGADREARAAIDVDPSDIWAAHAGAHVMDMTGRQRDGIAWIDGLYAQFERCNNFRYHIGWHRAIFSFDLGDFDRALELYDTMVRPESTRDFRDITNAAALLWRLDQEGVDVGDRWVELAEHCAARAGENVLTFAEVHYMMALAAGGDDDGARRLLDGALVYAASNDESQAQVMRSAGTALCEALWRYRQGDYGGAVDVLYPVRYEIRKIGGSHVQRDVFHQMLISAAIRSDRLTLARALLAERTALKPRHPLGWRHFADVQDRLGDDTGAGLARQRAEETA